MAFLFSALGIFAITAFFSGVTLAARGDGRFETRLAARARLRGAESNGRAVDFLPALLRLLTRWGERAGRGAIEQDKRGGLRLRLLRAGFASDRAVEIFFGVRAAAALAFALTGLLLAVASHQRGLWFVALIAVGANTGLFLPNFLLSRRIAARARAIRQGLPDAVDLMIVCVEAGVALSAAVQRVAAEFADLHPLLADQFQAMLLETQAGASRSDALARLADRSACEELGVLATMIAQSEAVGASLGGALRAFSDELRKTRHLEAERRASELPVKLAFPLVFLVFPAMSGVLFTPVLIRLIRTVWHG